MIRLAKQHEIDKILVITAACAKDMIANKIYQWNEHYPSRAAFENDVKRNELYALEDQNEGMTAFIEKRKPSWIVNSQSTQDHVS